MSHNREEYEWCHTYMTYGYYTYGLYRFFFVDCNFTWHHNYCMLTWCRFQAPLLKKTHNLVGKPMFMTRDTSGSYWLLFTHSNWFSFFLMSIIEDVDVDVENVSQSKTSTHTTTVQVQTWFDDWFFYQSSLYRRNTQTLYDAHHNKTCLTMHINCTTR